MRLIDADELKEYMKYGLQVAILDNNPEVVKAVEEVHKSMYESVMWLIDKAPTVDTVKHSRWEMYKTYYRCKVCKGEDAFGLSPYCKWCGRKMDLRWDEDETDRCR